VNETKIIEEVKNPPLEGREAGGKFIIAGGGTGGHIFPAIAIANAIKKFQPNANILFVGAKGKMEMEKVPQAGYRIKGLDIAGFNRSSLIKNIGLPYKLVKSFLQVRTIFKKFKPQAEIITHFQTKTILWFCFRIKAAPEVLPVCNYRCH